ncbi:MAG: hypothetical protein GDA56_07930 [Hormoscilla sp. GM7CHS1pb]|nr:hypothetical protein [Hormoscilla sp. GM7CHS1pb]
MLKNNLSVESETKISPDNPIGEMTLILDANFNFIDENWSLDIDSPLITAKLEKEEGID